MYRCGPPRNKTAVGRKTPARAGAFRRRAETAMADYAALIRPTEPATEETPDAVLSKGRCSHPLRGDRLRFPASGHPRRRVELAGQQLGHRGVQRAGGPQG